MFTAKVIKRFKDKHAGKVYKTDEVYSHKDEDRLIELAELGFIELGEFEQTGEPEDLGDTEENENNQENQDENQDESDAEFPKHTGGGFYELSNGEKVRGKEQAIEAQEKLNNSTE